MKKREKILGIFLMVIMVIVVASGIVHADVSWTTLREIDLDVKPLDVVPSPDGELIFVLAPGEVLVYSNTKNRVTTRIPVSKDFDRATYSARNNTLILTSSASKKLKILLMDRIFEIDISGLAFKGPSDAPVIVVSFDDYQ